MNDRARAVLLFLLGIVLVVFYVTFVTASTYYNPSATLLIVILGAFISIGGLLSSRGGTAGRSAFFTSPLLAKLRSVFVLLFLLTIAMLSADVVLTLYAVSTYGLGVEANKVVASLIERGAISMWLGQQFAPAMLTGIFFGMSKNTYVRTMAALFILGTLGYALVTVLNDILVVYGLSALPR